MSEMRPGNDYSGIGAPFITHNRGISRQPTNPNDKATIVSIFPKRIVEKKVGIFPSFYIIPPGTYEKPSVLHVEPAYSLQEIHEGMPLLEIPCSSLQAADAVVRDYVNSLLEYNTDSHPGLFYVPGKFSAEYVADPKATFKIDDNTVSFRKLLDSALVKQRNWFGKLVKQADTLWARSNGNPAALNEDMRMGATELGLTNKPWMEDIQTMEMTNCPYCGFLRHGTFPKCSNCHEVIDPIRYAKLQGTDDPNDIRAAIAQVEKRAKE